MDIAKQLSSTVTLLLVLYSLLKQGVAITCYMCNSAPTRNAYLCQTLEGDRTVFQQNCDYLPEALHQGVNYTVCRKIYQTIFDKHGRAEERVVRQCGTDTAVGCSWRSRPATLRVETCHCNTPLCNHAPYPLHFHHPPTTWIAVFLSSCLWWWW